MPWKVVSGVYVSQSGTKRVMTRTQFKSKLRLRGSGKTKPEKWSRYKVWREPKLEV